MSAPSPPSASPLPAEWQAQHGALHARVIEALLALPAYFDPEFNVSGILATDIVSLNTALGATIETLVVDALNKMRPTWDPNRQYATYAFVRQSQCFPDVLFARTLADGGRDILFGLELKGWYLLAKEQEPSFRMQATPAVCALPDLAVVFPWALYNVLSGVPRLFPPYIESARYVAEWRNHYWQHLRGPQADGTLRLSAATGNYLSKAAKINDEPGSDKGKNFGRIARTRIMDAYMERTFDEPLSGIPARYWLRFFKVFVEARSTANVEKAIEALLAAIRAQQGPLTDPAVERVAAGLQEVAAAFAEDGGAGAQGALFKSSHSAAQKKPLSP